MQNENTPAEGDNSAQTESESALRGAACCALSLDDAKTAAFHYCNMKGINPESMVYVNDNSHAPRWWLLAREIQDLALRMKSVSAVKDYLTADDDVTTKKCYPKIIQVIITPNDSKWQGMLIGLADSGDIYRLDDEEGWVIWFDGII